MSYNYPGMKERTPAGFREELNYIHKGNSEWILLIQSKLG